MFPTIALRQARAAADLTQGDLAEKLGVSPSVVSRLEAAPSTDRVMAERYLAAIGTSTSKEILEFYSRKWCLTDRPLFTHPDREALWIVERSLQELEEFEQGPNFDPILDTPLKKLRSQLASTAAFILSTDHNIAWIGDIGVGKTTALSIVTNITLKGRDGKTKSVFPTGGGRMTTCEVIIKVAPAFGVAVEALSEEEVRLIVTDFVMALKTGEGGISTELERVIRNMANLRRDVVKDAGGQRIRIDPILKVLETADVEQMTAHVVSRMNLPARTETQIILSQAEEGGLEWLATNIAKINNGQHPGFSVPRRVTVLLPSKLLHDSSFTISVIDTKGVEGTTQRPDLRAQLDDPRTLTVLCCRFNDAPGMTPESILHEIVEGGSNAIQRNRVVLLVLPRDGEAMDVKDDNGDVPETIEDAYLIKEGHVARALAKGNLPKIPVLFFNSSTDSGEPIWAAICNQIGKIRQEQALRVQRLSLSAVDLITNCNVAKTRQARKVVSQTMREVAQRLEVLPPMIRPAHKNLIDQIVSGHQSSIAAAVSRKGVWYNFPMDQMIGVGVRYDANLRTNDLFVRLDEQIAGLMDKYALLGDVRQTLGSTKDDLIDWRQEFLKSTESIGKTIFKPHFDQAGGLWARCIARRGKGSGYRDDIAQMIQDWFETYPEPDGARQKVEKALNAEWNELVLERLLDATNFKDEDNDPSSL
jgi:transcriptional regulator with XRE-family HTH domain